MKPSNARWRPICLIITTTRRRCGGSSLRWRREVICRAADGSCRAARSGFPARWPAPSRSPAAKCWCAASPAPLRWIRKAAPAASRIPRATAAIPQVVECVRLVSNAAPAALASLMPEAAAEQLTQGYAQRTPSISLFALTLGLSKPPREFGISAYSTQLLPREMKRLSDYAQGAALMADEPGERMPPMSIVDYAAIDSGIPAPPYVLSVFGPDLLSNWDSSDLDAYRDKRGRWQQAIVRYLDFVLSRSRRRRGGVVVQHRAVGAAISQCARWRRLWLCADPATLDLAHPGAFAAHIDTGPLSGLGLCRFRRLYRRGAIGRRLRRHDPARDLTEAEALRRGRRTEPGG